VLLSCFILVWEGFLLSLGIVELAFVGFGVRFGVDVLVPLVNGWSICCSLFCLVLGLSLFFFDEWLCLVRLFGFV
jgi:hypothetical protein